MKLEIAAPFHIRHGLDVQEFSAGGIRTFAVVEGRADAFPVIFLHGLPGGAFLWAGMIKDLGRERRAIAPDLPGWGRSYSRFENAAFAPDPQTLAGWLKVVAEAQSVDRFDLVAHGSGAWPALELLATDPTRIRRLALVSPRLWPDRPSVSLLRKLFGSDRWTTDRVSRWLDRHAALDREARAASRSDFVRLLGGEQEPRRVAPMAETRAASRFLAYHEALAAYQGATLLIWGDRDPAAPEPRTRALVESLREVEAHRIADAGHYPMLDSPAETTRLLKELLDD